MDIWIKYREYWGDDVAWIQTPGDISSSPLRVNELLSEDSSPPNTFRIFRHDWGHPPVELLNGVEFPLNIPEHVKRFISETNSSKNLFDVIFVGSGLGAKGTLDLANNSLLISDGGIGFADNPKVEILDDFNSTILRLDPSWIRVKMERTIIKPQIFATCHHFLKEVFVDSPYRAIWSIQAGQ